MNLADWLKKSHSAAEQVAVVEGVCDALHQSHSNGILKGEIGPASIELITDGAEILVGSAPVPAGYRAPESRSGASGPASAVYSAGVILYEILTGKHPFAAGGVQPEPLRNLRRDLPSELTDAVMACLESDPDWRPKDLSYVLQVLKRLRGSSPAAAPAAPARPQPAIRSVASRPFLRTTEPRPRVERVRAPRPRAGGGRPPFLAISVGVVVVIAAGVAYFWWSAGGVPSRPSTAPPVTVATPAPGQSPGAQPTAAPGAATPLPTATPLPLATPMAAVATPTPLALATPTPFATATPPALIATPPPMATPPPTPVPTPPPTPIPTPPPTPRPTATPAPTPVPIAAAPVVIKSIAPFTMARGSTNFYDLHGTGFRSGLNAVILKGRDVAPGMSVKGQKIVNATLMRVVVTVDGSVSPGSYSLALVDATGQSTNTVSFKVQ
jgi:hypothetical protein